ncbi:LytR/AlgR family response regulator transcription factor [Neolewinella agarilytica]|uniref:LytTr DNA-binding domain-containing protein n=1 Tax=Neolewinella agarilytica TaxID=478744 RepID=A0A1H9M7J7_9BACT|nr:LytTR family DNA-binding domain-containing protein [Neolewinella agarilytica]SER19455.1 LytTr DNA-binding domain-containing protein [Neolewinella agarilytica]
MKFLPSSILFLKADHVYTQIFLSDGRKILHRGSLSEFLQNLNVNQFVRTHRSYIVNLRRVDGYSDEKIHIGKHVVPISRSRKKEIVQRLSCSE